MSSQIDTIKPYQLSFIKNAKDFLIFSKNLFRLISYKGCLVHNDNFVYPLRWSIKKNCFVIDFGTQKNRDIEGICLNNINFFYKEDEEVHKNILLILKNISQDLENYLEKLRFKKNESKFLALSLNNSESDTPINILGIYNYCQYKNRKGKITSTNNRSILIDNSLETLDTIYSFTKNYYKKPEYLKINSYIDLYNDFYKEINSYEIDFIINKEEKFLFRINDFLLTKFNNKLDLKKANYYLQDKLIKNKEESVSCFMPVLLSKILCDFILEKLEVKTDLICYDENILKNIKIYKKIVKTKKDVNIINTSSYLPKVF